MGYGRAESIQPTSATGDAGIDGIISQDPLGLDLCIRQIGAILV
jgi:restriction system protein